MDKMLKQLEYEFTLNNANGIKNSIKNFNFINNNSNIILSAPHSVKQTREGLIKAEDMFTGAIVKYLIKNKMYDGIFRTYNDNDDPNYPLGITLENNDNKYINKIIMQNKYDFLLDIHGCGRQRPFDVELITAKGETCKKDNLEIFYEVLKDYGFNVSVDSTFIGGQVIRQTGKFMDSICIEINRNYRDIKKLEEFKLMLQGLDKSLEEVSKFLTYKNY